VTPWVRYYRCGCIPEVYHYCGDARAYFELNEELADMLRFDGEFLSRHELALAWDRFRITSRWIYRHLGAPHEWTDVPEPSEETQED
jgi:hypothetical protein